MKSPTATPTLTIVPEEATHVAFINGPTYTREEIIRAVNLFEDLLCELKESVDVVCWQCGADDANQDGHDEGCCVADLIAKAEANHA